MRRLQFITRIGHLRHQCADPGVQFQFQYAAVFGGTDILALNDFQVMRNAGQQEDVRQTGVNTAVGGGVSGIIQRRFLGGVCREEAGVIAILIIRERNKAKVGKFKFAGFGIITSDGILT